MRDYAAGYHPLFEFAKCLSRLRDCPFVIGAVAWWIGYVMADVQNRTRIVDPAVVAYVRREQIKRLGALFIRYKPLPVFLPERNSKP